MSVITDIMLWTGLNEYGDKWNQIILAVNEYPPLDRAPLHKVDVGPQAGGTKVFTSGFYAGSYNYFNLGGFVAHLRYTVPWKYPEGWTLVFDYEYDDQIRMYWQDGEVSDRQ
jgi:hypothetical protein